MYPININLFIFIIILIIFNYLIFIKYKKISSILNLFDYQKKNEKIKQKIGYPIGGIILFFNILIVFIFEFFFKFRIFMIEDNQLWIFFFGSFLIFLVGFFDDKFNLSPYKKLILLFLIFYFLLVFDSSLQITELRFIILSKTLYLELFSKFITVFFLLLFLNAFNMFDGINLQSGCYSIIVILFSFFFIVKINIYFFLLLFLFFFVYFNYKFNLFLGNSGSLLIAYIIGYYFIKFYNMNLIKFAEEIYIYMCIPGLDMFRLFITRIMKKKNPFKKDLFHIHHLILKKYNLPDTTLKIQSCIFFTLLSAYFISIQLAILFSLLTYLYMFFKYSRN
jgi:UDP-N-acetylmuramyl pentapeptide phosphotransferase/UDP-N-acetylglucosamine-1-phosphate transferase